MNSSSPKTASLPGFRTDPQTRLRHLILVARTAVTAERLLPALWPALGFAGLYLVLALTGLFAFMPWALQALMLAATITAIGLALDAGFSGFHWPRWQDGARRLERDSGLKHRPISESGDRLIGTDPFAQSLWQLHQARPVAMEGLKVARPDLDLTRRDPHNLRYLLLLALVVGLTLARGDIGPRLSRAFDSGAGATIGLDAWIDPPAYTGLAPIYLSHDAAGPIAVPAGALLNLRVHGAAHAPGVALGDGSRPRFTGSNGEYAAGARLTSDAHIRVRASGHTIGAWNLRVIPDAVPQIAFTAKPARTEHDATQFSFAASDDYGVTSARVVITPHGKQGAPLIVDLPLAEASAKSIRQTTYSDLTENPYAGLDVDALLEARDGAGQVGRSQTVTFRLPARVFTDPLARALIEQRQKLATATHEDRRVVAETLDALAIAPDRFYDGKDNVYMGLRAAYWGTRLARSDADIAHVENLLWQIAVSLEQNGLLDAAAQLRQLQALLTAALAEHAPQDVIDALLQKYNQAMQRYMQALENNPQAPQQQMQSGTDTKTITQDDIRKLMQAIQQMSAAGDREGAARLLAFLQNLLENLHMSQSAGGAGQDKSLNDAIQKFGDMMGKQRSLLDKTMRQRQGNGDPKDGGAQGLAKQQGELKKELDQMLQGMDPKLRQGMGDAGKSMDNAQKALGGSDLDNAGNEEKNALDSLRKGADALAQQQAKESGQQDGKDDPLGRNNSGAGNGVKLPGASDMAKARGILQELRKRAGERSRPQQELDYIDRLLKEF